MIVQYTKLGQVIGGMVDRAKRQRCNDRRGQTKGMDSLRNVTDNNYVYNGEIISRHNRDSREFVHIIQYVKLSLTLIGSLSAGQHEGGQTD